VNQADSWQVWSVSCHGLEHLLLQLYMNGFSVMVGSSLLAWPHGVCIVMVYTVQKKLRAPGDDVVL
jgi:hypothetical protein